MPDPRNITGKPTMMDVARRAGVSGMTVSRVMNGGDQVSEARQLAVHRAAEELGYSLNRAARALALAKSEGDDSNEARASEVFGQDAIDNSMRLASIAMRLGGALFRAFAASEFISGKDLNLQLEREGLDSAHATTLLLRSAFIMHNKEALFFLTANGAQFRHKATVAILAGAGIMDMFGMRETWPEADRQLQRVENAALPKRPRGSTRDARDPRQSRTSERRLP
ncbi:MAG: LacI family DNA-binding transcriptional regulator [Sphingomonas sp.]